MRAERIVEADRQARPTLSTKSAHVSACVAIGLSYALEAAMPTQRKSDPTTGRLKLADNGPFLTTNKIAHQLGVDLSVPRRWIMDGRRLRDGTLVRLEALRIPGQWRVRPEALSDSFRSSRPINSNPISPPPSQAVSRSAPSAMK